MASLAEAFADLLDTVEASEDYWLDIAISDFSRDLHTRMKKLKVTHQELANRMGTSRPYVTKLLSGGNFTLHTMTKLAMALAGVVRIHIADREAVTTHWKDEFMGHELALGRADPDSPRRSSSGNLYVVPLKAQVSSPSTKVFSSDQRSESEKLTTLGPLDGRRSQELFETSNSREALAV